MKAQRKVKLYPKHRRLDYGRRYMIVPELRISGIWLMAAGFEAGRVVNIEVSENQLIIKMSKDDNPTD